MTFSFALLVVVFFVWFLFRKSISRVTKVAPEVATIGVVNLHRAAMVADRHAAVAAASSALEAVDEARELAEARGLEFNGDCIDFCESVLKPHDYSSTFRTSKNQPQS